MDDMRHLDLNSEIQFEEIKEYTNEVPKLDSNHIAYSEFFRNFLLQNKPGILKNLTKEWKCTELWVKNESLNVDYFEENYGNAEVPVSNCGKAWFNIQEKCTMMMKDYLSYWKSYSKKGERLDCLYLKDWHFTKEFPNDIMYRVPCYFASDWLNEFYENNKCLDDDFRFVYIGPKGSWTPFHSDVLTSFSWSANICGRKRWVLLPPGCEENFKDEFGHLIYDLDEIHSSELYKYEVIQEKGEIMFVPSGWYHQVWNLEDAISINHNWINACNISNVWYSLKKSLSEVKKEISDFEGAEDWDEDCQKLLRASFGVDYYQFYVFISQIAKIRMEKLTRRDSLTVYGNWSFGKNHMIFDLEQILSLLNVLVEDADFQKVAFLHGQDDIFRFLHDLDDFLK